MALKTASNQNKYENIENDIEIEEVSSFDITDFVLSEQLVN